VNAGKSGGLPAALALAAALAGCAPPLTPPDTHVTAKSYLPPGATAAVAVQSAPLPAAWWADFGSQALDDLVTTGLQASPTIGQAQQVLAAATANAAANNGAFLPQVELNAPGNSSVSRQSYPTGPNGYPPYTIYTLTGTISYDPGLFGARSYTYQNGEALAAYETASLEMARQTLIGNIVAAVITEAGAQAQIATTRQIIAAQQSLLTLLQGEYADGAIPELSVLQQQSQILATQASLPPLQTTAAQQRDLLAVLTGSLPSDFADKTVTLDSLTIPAAVPVALPSAYLAQRPDLRAALAQVAAQNAALGIAVAHLYPDFTLSATGGYAAETVSSLFGTSSALWILAANLLAPIYEGGTLHDKKQAAQAQLAQALYGYRGAVLTAFGQAADALQAVANDRDALSRAQASAQTAIAAYNLGSAQYRLGAIDYTTVLNAQEDAARQVLAQVQARTTLLLDIAKLQSVMAN
jgi:NodT family efflux transporter outer membrane factor (OMF) lipoprotein